jgi:hypothetical protein
MESIGDFWKSARERVTNPFAFAYIIAWFSYNWRITVALFAKDLNYQATKQVISQELMGYQFDKLSWLNGIDIWGVPALYATCYIVVIAVIRQLVSELNIRLDKWGTRRGIKASGGGEVPVSKYLKARERLGNQERTLSEILRTESQTQDNYNKLKTTHDDVQEQLVQSKFNVSSLQTKMLDLEKAAREQSDVVNQNPILHQQLLAEQE